MKVSCGNFEIKVIVIGWAVTSKLERKHCARNTVAIKFNEMNSVVRTGKRRNEKTAVV